MAEAMPQQVPFSPLYSATSSEALALARQARAECLRDWMLAGWQSSLARIRQTFYRRRWPRSPRP
jgi:hypothetical protein